MKVFYIYIYIFIYRVHVGRLHIGYVGRLRTQKERKYLNKKKESTYTKRVHVLRPQISELTVPPIHLSRVASVRLRHIPELTVPPIKIHIDDDPIRDVVGKSICLVM